MKDLECCPFCGRCWEKKEKTHRKFLMLVAETAVALVTSTVMFIVLKWLGI